MDPKNFLGSVGESIMGLFGKKSKLAALAPPHLHSGVRFPYGPFQFKFQIPKGASYEIQVSSNLQNWQAVSAGKSGGEPVDYVDSEASKFSYRFYRVLAEAIFSDNVVGYVTINVPPGYSMIANPLQAPPNTISSILPNAPEGTTISDGRCFSRDLRPARNWARRSRSIASTCTVLPRPMSSAKHPPKEKSRRNAIQPSPSFW